MIEGYKPLTPEEIEEQIKQASTSLEREIVPPSKKEEVMNMPISEIKEKFPIRLKSFLKTRRFNKQGKELSEEEKEEMADTLRVLNNLDKYIEDHWVNGEKTLRDRQINVFEDIRDFLEEGGKDGYIKLPTGSGKTVIFCEFIESTGLRTLIVVPTKILVEQTEEKLNEFAEDLDVGKIYSQAKKQGTDVTIITYQSLVKKLRDGIIKPEDYKCLILDEAHVSLSDDRVEAINKFDHAIRLGFTATPQYSWNKKVENILPNEIHNLAVKEAAEEGIVSPFSVILVETDIDISNVKITSTGEYSQDDLQKAINIEGRNNSAVELYKQMFNGQLCVAYCGGIEHATEVCEIFNKEGINATVMSGRNSSEEQQNILKKFKEGEIKVICNADILIAGFDEQKASVCLNLRPTLSSVMAEQRGGRVLRLDKLNPLKHATIVDFIDKNTNNRIHQITFAEIAGASVVYPIPTFNPSFVTQQFNERDTHIAPDIKIEGLKVISDPMEVMRVVNRMKDEKVQRVQEGWIKPSQLAQNFKRGYNTIKIFAKKYRKAHPDWFDKYVDVNGVIAEYYSPELVVIVNKEFEFHGSAPKNWMDNNDLAVILKRSVQAINNLAEKFRKDHPEWFHVYLSSRGMPSEHYSIELVKEIRKKYEAQVSAPNKWAQSSFLAKTLGRDFGTIRNFTEKFRKDHPEWFREYLTSNNLLAEHYSPKLTKIIMDEYGNQIPAPEFWAVRNDLVNKIGRTDATIKRAAEKYRKDHPEWFHRYLTAKNMFLEHYSPKLVKLIEVELKNM